MKVTVIVTNEGRVVGVTARAASAETRVGYPSAWLVAGPGQRVVQLDAPADIVPRPEAEPPQVERFFEELTSRIKRDRR